MTLTSGRTRLGQVPRLPKAEFDYLPFIGGKDEKTPAWQVPPGRLMDCLNYVVSIEGGYEDARGYEIFDGQAAPSVATFAVFDVTITGSFSVGDTITQLVSGATAVVLTIDITTRAPQAYLVITKITGTFDASNDLQVSAVTEGNADATPTIGGAATRKLGAQYTNLAADNYRADIAAVPGSGSVLGIWELLDIMYAVRDNAGGSAADLYKSSVSGWTQVALGYEMNFTSGGTEYANGTVALIEGNDGSIDSITVNSVEIMSEAVGFDTDLATTAVVVAANITANTSSPNYAAAAIGTQIAILAVDGGTDPNGFVVVSTTTTIITTDVNMNWGATDTAIAEGDTVTGESSSETAVVVRVSLESGTWEAGTAAGRLIYTEAPSGAFQADETLKVGSDLDKCIVTADTSAITMATGGRFETVAHRFGGAADKRIYGCDGANRGFEFDGTIFCPIYSSMTADTPKHVIVHKEHLFFSFAASAQHSGIGTPYAWTPITGSGELATGDIITGFMVEPGVEGNATLGIYNRNKAHMLYGTSSANWNLVEYREEIGAMEWSLQQMGRTMFMGDRGITTLQTTQKFGNFAHATVSEIIQNFINDNRVATIASCRVRDQNQYRIFFTNKFALYITMKGDKIIGMMPQLLSDAVTCISSTEMESGRESIYFGSTDGKVYHMEKGTSFDGDSIIGWFQLHFHHSKSLRWLKKYFGCTLEAQGNGYAEYDFSYQLGYRTTALHQPGDVTTALAMNARKWDEAGVKWDAGEVWDGRSLLPSHHKIGNSAENISLIIRKNSDYFKPIRWSGAFLRYYKRRQIKNA